MNSNPIKTWLLLLLVGLSVTFTACSEKKDKARTPLETDTNPGPIDITTMATPNGGVLKAAENGPERSALGVPDYSLDTVSLKITGLIDAERSISWGDFQGWEPEYTDTMLMYCVEGWEVWGQWSGFSIELLLSETQLDSSATHIKFSCLDGYTTTLPIAYLLKYNAMLAFGVNGKNLAKNDGYPLRLIAPGKFGYKWAKWVTEMNVMDMTELGFWEYYGYSDRADVPLERRKYYEGSNATPLEY